MSRQEKLAALASTGITKAELDNIDGGTARGTTAIADGDGVLINDAGTMRMTSVDTLATYIGTKITGGSMVYIASSGAISNAANVSFTQFDATKYDHYQFWMQYVTSASDAVQLLCRTSTDGGSNYDATDGNYHVNARVDISGLLVSDNMGDQAHENLSGQFSLFGPHHSDKYTMSSSSNMTLATFNGTDDVRGVSGDTSSRNIEHSMRKVAEDVDAVQFIMSSGNIASGEIVMYGIANGT